MLSFRDVTTGRTTDGRTDVGSQLIKRTFMTSGDGCPRSNHVSYFSAKNVALTTSTKHCNIAITRAPNDAILIGGLMITRIRSDFCLQIAISLLQSCVDSGTVYLRTLIRKQHFSRNYVVDAQLLRSLVRLSVCLNAREL